MNDRPGYGNRGAGGYQPRNSGSGGYQPRSDAKSGGDRPPSRQDDGPKPESLIPLPVSLRQKASQLTHPGLALDKYAETLNLVGERIEATKDGQKRQRQILERMIQISNHPDPQKAWKHFHERQRKVWAALECKVFDMETIGGLSLHLARASALENAGICLHNLYGFPLIPGSGLKGMTRAWADNSGVAQQLVEQVFGSQAQSGAIVFYDAIPAAWPKMTVDIVNNHHRNYYDGKDAPGDWENPVPVYFLTVCPGSRFVFALGKARADVSDSLLEQAYTWLQASLNWSGAGAKTNAGYGLFKAVEGAAIPELLHRKQFTTTLELTSPAFLAGATQDGSDCDLRPATLRGMLRWWWRTMHSGFLTHTELLKQESLLFGDTYASGAIQIRLEAINRQEPRPYNKTLILNETLNTQRPPQLPVKTTQGLWYNSFGMDESKQRRYFLPSGASWKLSLLARAAYEKDQNGKYRMALSDEDVLEQAKSALWLLCQFGAVGAKERKGFGSLTDLSGLSLEQCRTIGSKFRQKMGLNNRFENRLAESPSLEPSMMLYMEKETTWTNAFWTLHQLGHATQAFAQKHKHNRAKKALGLPRNLRPPEHGDFRPPAKRQSMPRHASPTQFHLARNEQDHLIIRACFFVSSALPSEDASRNFLSEYRDFLNKELDGLLKNQQPATSSVRSTPATTFQPTKQVQTTAGKTSSHLEANKPVQAILLEEKTKKGGWKAKHEGSGLSGPIVNSAEVPADCMPNQVLELIVHSVNKTEISFRWTGKK